MGYKLIEDGFQVATIVFSEKRVNKKGTGHHIFLDFKILGGEYGGAHIFKRFNTGHIDSICSQKATESFKKMLKSFGKDSVETLDELIDLKVEVFVKTNAGNEDYRPSNFIYFFRKYKEPKGSNNIVSNSANPRRFDDDDYDTSDVTQHPGYVEPEYVEPEYVAPEHDGSETDEIPF